MHFIAAQHFCGPNLINFRRFTMNSFDKKAYVFGLIAAITAVVVPLLTQATLTAANVA
jgi:hypothetical protein